MPVPRFVTTSASGAPGVYILERETPSAQPGVATNIIGMTGTAVRGPVNENVRVTSFGEFLAYFGGRDDGSSGASVESELWRAQVGKTFGPLIINRAAAAAATTAEADFVETATPVINISATSPGTWGNELSIDIEDATDGTATSFNIVVTLGSEVITYRNLSVNGTDDNLAEVIGDFDTDRSILIVATKLASGRPDNVAAAALDDTVGANGTIADTDFTAADGPLESLAGYIDADTGLPLKAVLVAGQSTTAVKTKLNTLATASSDRIFLACPDDQTITKSAASTEVGTFTRDDRLLYCFNHTRVLDPETATLMWVEPHTWAASILSQNDADVHMGDAVNVSLLGAVRDLAFPALLPADYDTFTANGIAALERTSDGYVFADAPVTDRTQLGYRLMKDFLIRGLAQIANDDVKKANTPQRRSKRKGAYEAFLEGFAREQRYVDVDSENNALINVDLDVLNTSASRATGLQRDLVQVRLVAFNLVIRLEVEIGTTVTISEG